MLGVVVDVVVPPRGLWRTWLGTAPLGRMPSVKVKKLGELPQEVLLEL
jgi:hypothetical protein